MSVQWRCRRLQEAAVERGADARLSHHRRRLNVVGGLQSGGGICGMKRRVRNAALPLHAVLRGVVELLVVAVAWLLQQSGSGNMERVDASAGGEEETKEVLRSALATCAW